MKKLIFGLFSAFLLATGFVSLSAGSAASDPCPYTGCIDTRTSGRAMDGGRPGKVIVTYRVRTAGSADPRGTVRVIIRNDDTFRAKNRAYPAHDRLVFLGLANGHYQVLIKFIPGDNTSFGRSKRLKGVTVR